MRTLIALGLSVAVLAGCSGSPEQTAPEVVSLQPPGSAPASAPAAKAQVAPVIRPDTTSAEVLRMQQPWMQCRKANGVPMKTRDGLLDIDAGRTGVNGRIMTTRDQKVVKACGKLQPVYAPELDEDKNPYWADDDDNYHKCLVENGVPLVKKDGKWWPGPGWGELPPNEPLEVSCQAEAYDGRKG